MTNTNKVIHHRVQQNSLRSFFRSKYVIVQVFATAFLG